MPEVLRPLRPPPGRAYARCRGRRQRRPARDVAVFRAALAVVVLARRRRRLHPSRAWRPRRRPPRERARPAGLRGAPDRGRAPAAGPRSAAGSRSSQEPSRSSAASPTASATSSSTGSAVTTSPRCWRLPPASFSSRSVSRRSGARGARAAGDSSAALASAWRSSSSSSLVVLPTGDRDRRHAQGPLARRGGRSRPALPRL